MTISSHTIVCNEERYIWYSLMSIAPYVDKLFVWDTGSTDSTVEIVREVKKLLGEKLDFREMGKVSSEELVSLRQKMLDKTDSSWFLVLDGDEVWWGGGIKKLVKTIKRGENKLDSIVVPYYNLIGDIYHYQPESAGKYKIDGRLGHISIRAIKRNIPGLRLTGTYPTEAYVDGSGIALQEREKKSKYFLDIKFLHFTHLIRSATLSKNREAIKRERKFKYQLGREFPYDFYYPEVFFRPRPNIVPCPWEKMDFDFWIKSLVLTQFKKNIL